MYTDAWFVPRVFVHATTLITRIRSSKIGEKFTRRVGYLIENRYPDEATLLNIARNLGVSFYALSDPDVANIFSALHVLFDIEWAYGLRPTIKDGEVCFKFGERLPSAGPRPQEDLNNFRKIVEY